jgi:hypothetical protein
MSPTLNAEMVEVLEALDADDACDGQPSAVEPPALDVVEDVSHSPTSLARKLRPAVTPPRQARELPRPG